MSAFFSSSSAGAVLSAALSVPLRARTLRTSSAIPLDTPNTASGTKSRGSTETRGFWNIGAVGDPAPNVNAMTREVTPITSPPSSPVTMSCVSASTKTGSKVSASVAELTLSGIMLRMTVSANNSARMAMRLLFFMQTPHTRIPSKNTTPSPRMSNPHRPAGEKGLK